MFGYFRNVSLIVVLAAALGGCTTADLSGVADKGGPLAIRSVVVDGSAPKAIGDGIESDIRASLSGLEAGPTERPAKLNVSISTFSSRRDGAAYLADASVTVQLTAGSDDRVVKYTTFRKDASAQSAGEAERRVAQEIVAKVRQDFDLATPQAVKATAEVRRISPERRNKTSAAKPELSSDTLQTLQQAATGVTTAPDPSSTATVPLPAASCGGATAPACATASPLSGDLGLRK